MPRFSCSAREILLIVIVISALSALLLPPICGRGCTGTKVTSCASNLRQLYKLGTLHASQHQGQWPESGDENLWVTFTKMKPPLIEAEQIEILWCPVRGEELRPGETDYVAPRIPWSKLASNDPIAADKLGNHGDPESRCVLLKNGDVVKVFRGDPLWRRCEEVLR